MRGVTLVLVNVCLIAIVAGCGAGSTTAGPDAPTSGAASPRTGELTENGESVQGDSFAADPLGKAELIKRGDAICAQTDREQRASLAKHTKENAGTPSDAEEEKLILSSGLPPIKAEAEALAELSPPAGDEKEMEKLVSAIEVALKKAEADPGGLIGATRDPFAPAGKVASRYGFKVCAKPG
jgi:hypothetical protein